MGGVAERDQGNPLFAGYLVVLSLLFAAVGFGLPTLKRIGRQMFWTFVFIAATVGALAFGIGAALVLRGSVDEDSAGETQLYVECDATEAPKAILPGQRIYSLQVQRRAESSNDSFLMEFRGDQKGSTITWGLNGEYDDALMRFALCKFVNYGSAPLFNVSASIETTFQEVVKQDRGATGAGRALLTRRWTFKIPMIDADPEKPALVYIRNDSDDFVNLDVMPTARGIVGGQGEKEIRIIRPGGSEVVAQGGYRVNLLPAPPEKKPNRP